MRVGLLLLQAGEMTGLLHCQTATADLQSVIDRGWASPATHEKMRQLNELLEQILSLLKQMEDGESEST